MTQEVIGECSCITKVSEEIAKNKMFYKNSNKKTLEDIYNEDISIYEADFI